MRADEMSELNAAAALTLDINTGLADERLDALERRLTTLGLTGLKASADDAGYAVTRLQSQVDELKAALATANLSNSSLASQLKAQTDGVKRNIDGIGRSAQEAGKQLSGMSNALRIQLRSAEMTGNAAVKAANDFARAKDLANKLELRVIAAEEAGRVKDAAKAARDLARAKDLANKLELRVIRQEEVERAKELNRQLLLTQRYVAMSPKSQINSQIGARRLLDEGMNPTGSYATEAINAAKQAGSVAALEGRLRGLSSTATQAATGVNTLSDAKAKLGDASTRAALQMGRFTDAQWQSHAAARGLAGSLGALWMTYGALVPLLTGAAVGSALKAMVKTGAEVEYQLKVISAVGEGAKVAMNDLASATQGSVFSFGEATNALRVLVQAGMSSNEALQTLPQVLKLATVGEVELGQGALTVAAMLETFNLSVGEAGRVTNTMAAAAASSPTSVGQMMEAMKQASTVSAQYNVSIEETSAALAVLAKRGIEGSAAGTAFRNLVKEMAAPATRQAAKALEDMGVSMYDANGNIKPLVDNLQQLADTAALMSEEDRIKWFESFTNERAAKALSALVGDMEGYRKALQEVTAAQEGLGFVTEANAELMTSVSGQWKQLGSDISRVFADVYTQLQPALLDFTLAMRDVVSTDQFKRAIEDLASALLSLTEFVVDNAAAIGKFFAVLAGYSIVKVVSSSLVSLGRAIAGLGAIAGVAAAFASAKGAFIAANVGASGLAASIGGLGVMLANPVGAAIAATVVGLGGLAWYLSESGDKATDAALAAKDLANKSHILADSAMRGRDEIYNENTALEEHILKLRSAAGATKDLVGARKWAALEDTKGQAGDLIQRIQSKRSEFAEKWNMSPEEAQGMSSVFTSRNEEAEELQSMLKEYRRLESNIKQASDGVADARAGAERNRALSAEARSLELVISLNEKRNALVEAGIKAETALSSGQTFSKTYTDVLKQQVEAGKKAREAIVIDPSTFDANNKAAVASVHRLQDQLGQITIKPPKIESPKKPDFAAIDQMRAGMKDAQQTIRDFDADYQTFVTNLQTANREGEVSSVDMFNAMAVAAENYAELKKRTAREAAQASGMNKSAVQDMLNAERQANNDREKALAGIDLARAKNIEQSLRAVEKAEVESGKRRLNEVDQFNQQWKAKYGDAATTLAAALADAEAKGLPAAERLRTELNRLLDAEASGRWAVGIKQSLREASDEFGLFSQKLERIGEKSSREGLFGFLNGTSAEFTRMNAERIAALRTSLSEIQAELDRQPNAEIKTSLLIDKQSLEEELRVAEETVDPTLQRWGDTFGDYIADGLIYGFDQGESPAKAFANMLKRELAQSLSDALSKEIKFSLSAMLGGSGQSGSGSFLSSLLGSGQSGAGGSRGSGAIGQAQNAYSLYNNASVGYQWATGSMSGANAAGTMWANTTGTGLDGLLATNGAYGTAAPAAGGAGMAGWGGAGAGAYLGYRMTGGNYGGAALGGVAGYGAATGMATGAGAMAGTTAALAAIPVWGWIAIAALAIGSKYINGGTPHQGAAVFAGPDGATSPKSWEETLANYADPLAADGFGQKDFYRRRQQGVADALAPIAEGSAALVNNALAIFDQEAKYKVGIAFSSDRDDKSRGALSILDADGSEVGGFSRKYDRKAERAIPQLADDIAGEVRTLLVSQMPDWADNMLSKLGDKPSMEALEGMVGQINNIKVAADRLTPALGITADELAGLVETTGSFDAAVASLDAFAESSISASEKWEISQRLLSEQFDKLNVAVPQSSAEFNRLVEGLDLSVAAERELAVGLLNLAPAFYSVASAVESAFAAISASTAGLVEQFKTDIMNSEEKYAYLDERIAKTLDQLAVAVDPATVQSLYEKAAADMSSAWQLLQDDEKKRLSSQYIDKAYELEALSQARLSVPPLPAQNEQAAAQADQQAEKIGAAVQKAVADAMTAVAEKLAAAGGDQAAAAGALRDAVASLPGRIVVSINASEVGR